MSNILPDVSNVFVCLCKKAYVPLRDENDESLISNVGAIKTGLRALRREAAEDDQRALQYWAEMKGILESEEANDIGASAEGTASVDDSYEMHQVGIGL